VSLPGAAIHDGSTADTESIARVLTAATRALDGQALPYVLIGGIASAALGRRRCSSDIDLLVMPESAPRALELLEAAGFTTEKTNPNWLFKAFRDSVLVDVLFKSKGDIYLDEEMLDRAKVIELYQSPVRVISAEDLIVMKILAFDEETPRHWYDALGLIAAGELDWDYLIQRARKGYRRVLSLLIFATSMDLSVPTEVIDELSLLCFGPWDRGSV
jgi:predicted nucleotidyltransferase